MRIGQRFTNLSLSSQAVQGVRKYKDISGVSLHVVTTGLKLGLRVVSVSWYGE